MGKAGTVLKQVLEAYGISQNKLAVAMGIGRSSINRWVNENRDPGGDAILEIKKGLNKSLQRAGVWFGSAGRSNGRQ